MLSALLLAPAACGPDDGQSPEDKARKIASKLKEADTRFTNNRAKDAESIYNWILSQEPEHGGALRGLGQVRIENGLVDEAIPLLTRAAAATPQDHRIHAALGTAYEKKAQHGEAAAAFGEAFKLDGEQARYGLQQGKNLLRSKQYAAAETVLRKTGEVDAEVRYVWSQLGEALRNQTKHDEALKAYMKGLSLYQSDKEAHAGAALIYEARNETQKAVNHWSTYVRMDCCSKYSKTFARPKLEELQARENREIDAELAAGKQATVEDAG